LDTLKTIVIAGSGSGIGKAILEELQIKNLKAIGLSRRGVLHDKVPIHGKNYKCDLRDAIEVKETLEWIGKIDALFITLGDGLFKSLEETSLEEWESHLKLNLTAPFLLLKNAYPQLKKADTPLVVVFSSTAGKVGFPESSAYCTTKHGIAGMAKSIREEWKPKIRVVTVYPGAVFTPIWEGREGFKKEDMIPLKDFALQMVALLDSPPTLNIEEMYILPPKGVL
jgi:NAD(P)-dependent dehydrogenase (short-subunit alcohol dehydrogenase family)